MTYIKIDWKEFHWHLMAKVKQEKMAVLAIAKMLHVSSYHIKMAIEVGRTHDLLTYLGLCQWMGNAPDTYVLNWNATYEQESTPA